MKFTIEVEVHRVEGKNLSAAQVGEHIIDNHILPGELPDDPGMIWVGQFLGGQGAAYRIVAAQVTTNSAQ